MKEKEETRKIQYTGKSSYIISLPKQWITDMDIKKGDQVRIVRHGSSVLHVYPSHDQRQHSSLQIEDATIEISIDETTSSIIRRLISLYFLGFKTINVRPKNNSRLKPDHRAKVKDSVKRMLMGSEIISDSTRGITIQVLVNLLELSVNGAFKRMLHLAKSMLNDAILAIKEENLDLAREVISTDDEVDRFGFYIIRQLEIAIQNDYMLEELGFKNARSCLGYRIIVKSIERTGDHAVLVAKDLLEFKKSIKKNILLKIQKMNDFAIKMLDDACLSLFTEDYFQAEKTIERTKDIAEYERIIKESTKSLLDDEEIYRIRRMSENVRRIAEYASDIAEIVLNINIEKTLKKETY